MQKHKTSYFLLVLLAFSALAGGAALPTGSAAAQSSAAVSPPYLAFETVVSGLDLPLFATHAGDGSGRLFVVERGGRIKILKNGALNALAFLNISSIVNTTGGEQGLLGLAFHPDYETNRYFYVTYIDQNSAINLARYQTSPHNPDWAPNTSGQVLLTIAKTRPNHNGGMLAFGPDGYLYMSTGDGGGPGDPDENGQDLTTLLGKVLRLDVDSASPYAIPAGNPFFGSADPQVKQEIWAYGLRNPWRFSFDSSTGDLYIADVGQNAQEEVNFQAAGDPGGANYGWNTLEGNLCYDPSAGCVAPTDYVPPVAVYDHGVEDENGCSVTGGYVYRGSAFPDLEGIYLYADYCLGKIYGLEKVSGNWNARLLSDTPYRVTSIGEGEDGALYLIDYETESLVRIVEATLQTTTKRSLGSYDGWMRESTESSNTGGALGPASTTILLGDCNTDRQYRSILHFNTASLPDDAVLTKATLKIKRHSLIGSDPFPTHGNLIADIRSGAFYGSPALQAIDFKAASSRNFAATILNNPAPGNWYSGEFKDGALPFINLTGSTQVRLRFYKDDNDDMSADFLRFYSGEAANPAYRPALEIEYYTQYTPFP